MRRWHALCRTAPTSRSAASPATATPWPPSTRSSASAKKTCTSTPTPTARGWTSSWGPGCVARIEIAYAGTGRFAPTCIRFRKAVEKRRILFEDYSNYQMTLRFMAGAMGVPFLPTRSSLGTDIVNRWGFSKELRQADPRLPDR